MNQGQERKTQAVAVSDRELLERLGRGDMQALGDLYDRHHRTVYHFLLARLEVAEAEEALGEVFLALAERGRKLREVESAAGYLLGIARHVAARWRKRRRPSEAVEDEPVATDEGSAVEVTQLLRPLPVEQAEVVILKVWHGFTFEEIGRALNISSNTAASRYRYGIEKLRGLWGEE